MCAFVCVCVTVRVFQDKTHVFAIVFLFVAGTALNPGQIVSSGSWRQSVWFARIYIY